MHLDEEEVAAQQINGAAGGHGNSHEPTEQVEVIGREQARSCANSGEEGDAGDEQRVFEAEKQCTQSPNGSVFVEAFPWGVLSMSASMYMCGD